MKAQLESWPAAGDPEHDASVLLELAPDSLHKADVSGGPAYGIALPFWGADPILANEAHALPFTDYLRLCFRWGCFPLLARHAEREDVQSFVAEIGRDLEPF